MPEVREVGRNSELSSTDLAAFKREAKGEVKELSPEKYREVQEKQAQATNGMMVVKALENRIQDITDKQELYFVRLGIEALRSMLKDSLSAVDKHMAATMKEEGIKQFDAGVAGSFNEATVFLGQERTKKVKKPAAEKLTAMLKSDDIAHREMALRALSTSPSAWKFAKVVEMCDSLGYEVNDFCEVIWKDKIVTKYIPKFILNRM